MFKRKLYKKVEKLNNLIEKSNIVELTYILGNKKEIFIRNVLAGLARGVGIGIGVTLITAILVIIMQRIVRLNIPVIGEYIVDIYEIVKEKRY